MSTSNTKPPIDRLATGIRMATVVVVLGTLVAVWHPGTSGPSQAATTEPHTSALAPARSVDVTSGASDVAAPGSDELPTPAY